MGTYLVQKDNTPERARFPVIDAHNHLFSAWDGLQDVVRVMDAVGVACQADLTANLTFRWVEGGYGFQAADLQEFIDRAGGRFPGRFYGFTAATFAGPTDQPLIHEYDTFVDETVAVLRDHVRRGARGLKVLKELGLHYRDATGQLVRLDDERLAPIWEEAGRLGVPVLMHQSDPCGFFDPVTPDNERYESLQKYPSWSFADPKFPRKAELIERRDRVVAAHPGTVFMLPHVANFSENLPYVARLLDAHSNVYIDFSARCDELGRQPYTAREFLITHQDRVCFGTDMPASVPMYRFYFRFLETFDEYFIPPDYEGNFGGHRWRVHGLGLPDHVLHKIYALNALKIIPGLRNDYEQAAAKGTTP